MSKHNFKLSVMSSMVAAMAIQSAPLQAQEQAEFIEEVLITGRAAKLYRVQSSNVGKLPTEPLESSQTVSALTVELIEDQGARDAGDLYRNISGVSFYSFAGVSARGFRQEEIYYDGLRGDPNAGFAVPQLFNIQRVEFLKGPAGMLYGPGAPGGLFNYVTKKPTDTLQGTLRAVVGDEDRRGAMAEVSGPLSDSFSGRAGVFYEDKGLLRHHASQETEVVDLGLSYSLNHHTTATLQYTHYDMIRHGARLRGVPVDDEGNFITSVRWNHNEPTDFLKMRSEVAQFSIDSRPIEGLTLDATLRYNDADEAQNYHEMNRLFDSTGDGQVDSVRRQWREQERNQENVSFGANAVWDMDLDSNIRNRVLVGMDYFTGDENRFASRLTGENSPTEGLPPPLSLFNPVYGQVPTSTYDSAPVVPNEFSMERQGFYVLDEVTVGPVVMVGGLRYDSFEDDVNGEKYSDSQVSYRLGGVYRARDDVSLYAQYATSFEPQDPGSQIPQRGGPFDPSQGDMVEMGLKTALMGGRIQSSAAIYQIRRDNVLQDDPRGDVLDDGFDNLLPAGEVTSRGLELDLAVDITPDWVATVNYAYNRIRITEGFTEDARSLGDNIGDRFANAPEHTLGFWTRYQFGQSGWAVALGGDFVDERISVDDQVVQSYTIFDASVIYETGPWRAMLRMDNLLDEEYATAGFRERTGHYVGKPRTAFLELRYTIQ
ncbi:TonB-dependent siderophore receptor [Marinimicrobium alkaliphilum]|uniref:TonB-dependent siderophore receptor n=1 Tax=Marinimicrobium alkaliphilum TaxID=2202654 RepID=UPI000DBA7036|nr:TonB-dependent siderophore receptor [Marinimicrobium alkaliphilum]